MAFTTARSASLSTAMLALALALVLAGCAKPTPYRPAGADSPYGYRETKLTADIWRVEMAGNSVTPRDLVENQLLYRAAQIALANDATGFVVLHRELDPNTRYYSYGPAFGYYRPFYGGGVFFGPSYTEIDPVTRFTAYAEIELYRGEPPASDLASFDAKQVIENLRYKINLPPPTQPQAPPPPAP